MLSKKSGASGSMWKFLIGMPSKTSFVFGFVCGIGATLLVMIMF